MAHVRQKHRTSMRLGWLFMRSDFVAFSGESNLKDCSTGFRTRATVLPHFRSSCTWDSLRRKTAIAATEPGNSWPLGRCVDVCGKVLGRGPDRSAIYHRYSVFLRRIFPLLGPFDFRNNRESRSRPSNDYQKTSNKRIDFCGVGGCVKRW